MFLRPLLCTALCVLVMPLAAAAQVADRAGLFFDDARGTASSDVAVDAQGGLHAAYVHYEPEAEGAEVVYASCPGPMAACGTFVTWASVELMPSARDVQVALTSDGRPRLLIVSASTQQAEGQDYSYAECDAGCEDAAHWTVTRVATNWDTMASAFATDWMPQRTFLLDAANRPQFLYSDRNYLVEPDHYGTFWMTCKADCADAANWVETDIAHHAEYDTEIFDAPALALTPEGRPRVVSRLFALSENGEDAADGLYYLSCDSGCRNPASWRRTWMIDTGSGSYPSPTWDLAIDAQGRPRVALFTGDGLEQDDLEHSLIYFWCDAADCLSENSWNGNVVANEGHGQGASLALDAEGRPRMAFLNASSELGFAWCDEACETPEGAWDATLVEGQGDLQPVRPTALPFTCDGELWHGLAPQLTLQGDGRPLVTYDLSVEGRCLYHEDGTPDDEILYNFHQLWRGARLLDFAP